MRRRVRHGRDEQRDSHGVATVTPVGPTQTLVLAEAVLLSLASGAVSRLVAAADRLPGGD